MNLIPQIIDPFSGLHEPRKEEVVLCRRNIQVTGEISSYAKSATVVIAMPLHNQASTLRASIVSAISQVLKEGHCAIVLLDDQSTDNWQKEVDDILPHPAVIVITAHCGSAANARNAILDFVETELPSARWIARLDSDDLLCSEVSVEALVSPGEAKGATFVIGSNHLVQDGTHVEPSNIAESDVLLDPQRLAKFIADFCNGDSLNELPSCNILIRTQQGIRYPLISSAEDHWLVSQLLMFRSNEAAIVRYPIYCHYTLNGKTTISNEKIGTYHQSRKRLAMVCRTWINALSSPANSLAWEWKDVSVCKINTS